MNSIKKYIRGAEKFYILCVRKIKKRRKQNQKRVGLTRACKPKQNMDLMSAICSSDYNQPNSRSASLKSKSRTQSKSINKAAQMAHTECSLKRLQSHRFSDYFDCCDDRSLAMTRPRRKMYWDSILVFSVIVLINIASINCTATRQLEGESKASLTFIYLSPHTHTL